MSCVFLSIHLLSITSLICTCTLAINGVLCKALPWRAIVCRITVILIWMAYFLMLLGCPPRDDKVSSAIWAVHQWKQRLSLTSEKNLSCYLGQWYCNLLRDHSVLWQLVYLATGPVSARADVTLSERSLHSSWWGQLFLSGSAWSQPLYLLQWRQNSFDCHKRPQSNNILANLIDEIVFLYPWVYGGEEAECIAEIWSTLYNVSFWSLSRQ